MIDGGMAISSQAVVGTRADNYSGNIRTRETYAGDQSSQLQLTSTQLSGGQWIGVGVRAQNSGQDIYLGMYWWNSGNPVLMLFERSNGNWTQLGATYPSGPLAAGTQLQLSAVGSTITFSQDGIARITATDTTLTGGAPAVMAFDTPTADNWQGTGATGIAPTYSVGGTVSGLTGSVVLQDNGADDLAVSRERHIHVQRHAGDRHELCRHGQDQPGRSKLHASPTAPARSPPRTSPTSPSPAARRASACSSSTPTRTASSTTA